MGTEPIRPGDRSQRLNLNVWDSFTPSDAARDRVRGLEALHLFGIDNMGNTRLCNAQVPHMLVPSDHAASIQNWYARRDPEAPPLGAWAEATTITLVVGQMPIHQLPLSDLLQRREGQRDEAMIADFGLTGLARELYVAHEHEIARTTHGPRAHRAWCDLTGTEAVAWMLVARQARSLLRAPLLAIVPGRQHCSVVVTVPPDPPPSDHRIWIHLEGIQGYDLQ